MNRVRTILADDHEIFLDGLEKTLCEIEEIDIVAKVSRGNDVIYKLETISPDLLILDVNMPQKDGVEILSYIQKSSLKAKILVLSYYLDYALIKKVLNMGIMGYVPKDAGKEELHAAVRSIMDGKPYLPDSVKEIIKTRESRPDPHDDFVSMYNLTKREVDILTEVAREFSTAEIADKLCLSEYTVETYRKSIIRKLAAKNIASLVNFAHKWKLI
ncbi:response regulator [Dyadobacter fermentans]|uniref:Two component transcriptional regulator, LuxR family n=1 Tax=Dyadobacter fermentans (strain ATCC 700827 / DSM 18053 / CIP 107007 / KCTC 52180 / NS114) TaxID=471854 RepID=C6VZM4_DYAFD|nr:response regulator transcription factor [Dyadobacter fermentans]ACT93502.1 two component transcriptional regulator, LuxR family [Dyadobacter fermentans DSM 18053]